MTCIRECLIFYIALAPFIDLPAHIVRHEPVVKAMDNENRKGAFLYSFRCAFAL